jgi:hypothetical protein
MLDNYSLDWMLESLVQALGPRILMAGVGAHTQSSSLLLLTNATTPANAPFVFGVLQADLLLALAGKKGIDLEQGTQVHIGECTSWTRESVDPEDALQRFLCLRWL